MKRKTAIGSSTWFGIGCSLLVVTQAACALMSEEEATRDEAYGAEEQELGGGTTSGDNPINNATVKVLWNGGSCSGTLVKADIVITAGHCLPGRGHPEMPDSIFDEKWHLIPTAPAQVRVGPDSLNPRFTATARYFTHPRIDPDGIHVDFAVLGLDQQVPADIATPRQAALERPAIDSSTTFAVYGYGGGRRFRQFAMATGYADLPPPLVNAFDVFLTGGAFGEAGDSGGSIFHGGTTGPVIGVIRAVGSGGLIEGRSTFGRGDPGPDVSAFLRTKLEVSFCGQIRGQLNLTSPAPLAFHWHSPSRGDNLTTTDPAWGGCEGDVRSPDYRFSSLEGRMFSAARPRPAGTRAIHLWYSPSRADNFTTSAWTGGPGDVRSPDYQYVALQGYAYDPASPSPGPGTVAMHSWFSPSRGDNYGSTSPGWQGGPGDTRSPDYRWSHLVGHLLTP
jgi:Trypsin